MRNRVAAMMGPVTWLVLVHVFFQSPSWAGVTTYPAPPGEAITGDYAVTVNGKPVDVYAAQSQCFDMLMEQCHFEDIRVRSSGEDMLMLMAKPMRCRYGVHKDPEPGRLRDCSFKNIQVVGEQGAFRGLFFIWGDGPKHDVSRLRFEHVTYFGRPVTQDSPCVRIGPHVADVTFRK